MSKNRVVVEISGNQLLVSEGEVVYLEKINAPEGESLTFDRVLVAGDIVGRPYVEGAYVEASIQKQGKQAKIVVYRHNAKSTHKRKLGHRQEYTRVLITKVHSK